MLVLLVLIVFTLSEAFIIYRTYRPRYYVRPYRPAYYYGDIDDDNIYALGKSTIIIMYTNNYLCCSMPNEQFLAISWREQLRCIRCDD
jgi:hypothetical protein